MRLPTQIMGTSRRMAWVVSKFRSRVHESFLFLISCVHHHLLHTSVQYPLLIIYFINTIVHHWQENTLYLSFWQLMRYSSFHHMLLEIFQRVPASRRLLALLLCPRKTCPFPFDHCRRCSLWSIVLWSLPPHRDEHHSRLDKTSRHISSSHGHWISSNWTQSCTIKIWISRQCWTSTTGLSHLKRTRVLCEITTPVFLPWLNRSRSISTSFLLMQLRLVICAIVIGGFHYIRHLSTLNRSYHWDAVMMHGHNICWIIMTELENLFPRHFRL